MKKIIIGISIVLMMSSVAMASVKDNCGCGLGSVMLKENKGDSLLIQLVATFLNGICGNQTFGITSGTLGCDKPAKLVRNEVMDKYVADNMDNLAVDIAAGGGESLDALAEIAGVSVDKKATLYAELQKNFDNIFQGEAVTNKTVVSKINTIIATI